jgi:uncharacterized protein YjbI with pentapeptide repeats
MLKLAWPWQSGEAAEGGSGASRREESRHLPPLDLHGASLPRVDLSDTDLEEANFCDTNFAGANLRRSNLRKAKLKGAILRGADLREAENLTWEQLSEAVIDEMTKLPGYLADGSKNERRGEGS